MAKNQRWYQKQLVEWLIKLTLSRISIGWSKQFVGLEFCPENFGMEFWPEIPAWNFGLEFWPGIPGQNFRLVFFRPEFQAKILAWRQKFWPGQKFRPADVLPLRGILSATFGNWQPIFHFYFYSVAVCRIFVRALFILLWRSIFVSIKTLLLLFESNLDKFTCIVIQKFFLSSLYHIRVQKATCYNCNSL